MANHPATALITGASSRIGAAIATDLASNGWSVVLHAHRSLDKVRDLENRILGAGGTASVICADLTDPDQLSDVLARASAPFGVPDLVVNNASIFETDGIGDLDGDRFDRHFAIHVKAPCVLADSLAATLPADRKGLIVNMIDQRVWKLTPQYLSYTLSKAAMWAATQTLAQALAPRIRVNAIGPGPSFRNERQTEDDFRRQTQAVLLRHGPDPAEFGRTVRFLWDAASMTGQMIALDGGQHLAWETADVVGVGE
ncbi:SDR family oxidoreductase [Polymorphum gilvum]|uniref:Oxidoreductase, short chain dehydrogenase/reductase family n=1 Tax=Polymorphum gilvum (strain LMG 25793 / CGMCC 1.9160 / SL003B-26A1) TaxID=991905 RepID=F2J0H6_POLGS|nr:SDR family oxidoreductase [Polymorphum gilvum]ADZ69644.1 Oxidoreductase, short chain dehydrogenase/reductase family [Polymorphum gilvum SL003B-26A1]